MSLKSEMIERAMIELRDEYRYNVRREWNGDYGWGDCLYVQVFYENKDVALQELKSLNAILYQYGLVGAFKSVARIVRYCGELRQMATVEIG